MYLQMNTCQMRAWMASGGGKGRLKASQTMHLTFFQTPLRHASVGKGTMIVEFSFLPNGGASA
jgi:hypothetical protein